MKRISRQTTIKGISCELIFSGRRTLRMEMTREGQLILRAPYGMHMRQIEAFVEASEDWILKTGEKCRQAQEEKRTYTEEEKQEGRKLAARVIKERCDFFAACMGVSYGEIHIREQKTRWGSCSKKGNLNFNWKLVLMPREILDYLVVHELAHRIYMDHSAYFWNEVEKILPDYKKRRKWLKENGCKF